MLDNFSIESIYLACGSTDMRKSIDGLAVLVQEHFLGTPLQEHSLFFVIKTEIKSKYCIGKLPGLALLQKSSEKDRFKWPKSGNTVMNISPRELRWLLDGLSLEQKSAHPEVRERKII